jgi:hypothetical protein
MVTPFAALIELRATLPKSMAAGDTENVDLTPVPDNDTDFVLATVPAVTLRFAVFDPVSSA